MTMASLARLARAPFLAALLALASCGGSQQATALPTATPLAPTSTSVPPTSAPTLTSLPTSTPMAVPSATRTPNAAATAAARAAATKGAAEAEAVKHLGAGNTLLQAKNLPGAVHEYQTAGAYAPWRADVQSAAATAQAQVAAATATAQAVLPMRLLIPAIGVNAPIEYVGLTPDGAMEAPQGWWDAGWYRYGPAPGQPGNAVIAGHLDSTTGPAVFWFLGALGPGAKVQVAMTNGATLTFTVQERDSYPYNNAPLGRIFGPASTPNLNLITCGGTWDAFQHNYSNRTVLYAREG